MSMRLHAFIALRVFDFVRTLPRPVATITASERKRVAFGGGNVFAIHALQVESVRWISGCMTSPCTTFGIGCLWEYVVGARGWVVWALLVTALRQNPDFAANVQLLIEATK
jgi:hypothetical protein